MEPSSFLQNRTYKFSWHDAVGGINTLSIENTTLIWWYKPANEVNRRYEIACEQEIDDFKKNGPQIPIPSNIQFEINLLLGILFDNDLQNGDSKRHINITEDDWLWVTYLKRKPQKKPDIKPFNFKHTIEKIRTSKIFSKENEIWDWSRISIPITHTKEEASFWLQVILSSENHEIYFDNDSNEKNIQQKFAMYLESNYSPIEVSFDKIINLIFHTGKHFAPELIIPLYNILSHQEIITLISYSNHQVQLQNIIVPGKKQELPTLANSFFEQIVSGFHSYILPFLSEKEISTLRDMIRPYLVSSKWPVTSNQEIPAIFRLASFLGCHREIYELIRLWPDDFYKKDIQASSLHRPQEIIFGLANPLTIISEMTRLGLLLDEPAHVRAWLAHTHYSDLDTIKNSIKYSEDSKKTEKLLRAFTIVHAPEVAPHMLELMLLSNESTKIALQWFDDNPILTIHGLMDIIANPNHDYRKKALNILQRISLNGYTDNIYSIVKKYFPSHATKIISEITYLSTK